jgi:hypothetical protein
VEEKSRMTRLLVDIALARSIELHSAQGKTAIAVDADLAHAVREGAVLTRS